MSTQRTKEGPARWTGARRASPASVESEVPLRSPLEPGEGVATLLSRRHFLNRVGLGLGAVALASLLNEKLFAQAKTLPPTGGPLPLPHFAGKAKRVIYLFQSGAPSQIDL